MRAASVKASKAASSAPSKMSGDVAYRMALRSSVQALAWQISPFSRAGESAAPIQRSCSMGISIRPSTGRPR
ncbi:hypothetical protein G6F65_022396 [Rhizopus arrhizus]|nr:hypothetical protein G6F31_021153 [Rhizopus arrhizus]KAG1243448.1 hypothetical protein G6F65_022396 [Rhizopus arrhizus]